MKRKITSLVSVAMSVGMVLPFLSTTTVAASLNDGESGGAFASNRAAYYSFEQEAAQDVSTDGSNRSQAFNMYNELWNENYQLNEKYLTDMEEYTDYNHPRHYLGQPDMVRTRTGKLITAYPVGHGVGPLVMRTSTDNGETWVEKTDTPQSWENSQETPTLYTLTLPDGREPIMLITACPTTWGKKQGGWETSYSDDDGETWTPYKSWHPVKSSGEKRQAIVAMASLVQMRNPQTGEFIPKWMGIYHDDSNGQFVNYKTYLTFENEGGEWVENGVSQLSFCPIIMTLKRKRVCVKSECSGHRMESVLLHSQETKNTMVIRP